MPRVRTLEARDVLALGSLSRRDVRGPDDLRVLHKAGNDTGAYARLLQVKLYLAAQAALWALPLYFVAQDFFLRDHHGLRLTYYYGVKGKAFAAFSFGQFAWSAYWLAAHLRA